MSDDHIVRGVEQRLANAASRTLFANRMLRKPLWVAASGQWVARHVVLGIGLAVLLVGGTVGTYLFIASPSFQEGLGQGMGGRHEGELPLRPTPAPTR